VISGLLVSFKSRARLGRLVDSKSVETEALNQIIAKKKLMEQERELRSIVLRFGNESYTEMMQMRRDIRAAREREFYATVRLKRNIMDAAIIGTGAMVSIALIVGFFVVIL
jgi:hypothetical protein